MLKLTSFLFSYNFAHVKSKKLQTKSTKLKRYNSELTSVLNYLQVLTKLKQIIHEDEKRDYFGKYLKSKVKLTDKNSP